MSQQMTRIKSYNTPFMEVLSGIAISGVIFYGGSQVISGNRTTGEFTAFIFALISTYDPLKRIVNTWGSIQQGLTAAEGIFAMIDKQPTITDRAGAAVLDRMTGAIRLEDVHFSYGPAIPALRGISIDIPAGKTVALVGPSGAGKSTLLNLIPRFYDPSSGTVRIDGHDIREVTQHSLREQIGLVSQETTLFDATVRDNIAYARPGASQEEIEAAARGAAAHDFISALPQGYDTQIGEHGVRLSGGQRQRLSIARAMLKHAPILLLDEAPGTGRADPADDRPHHADDRASPVDRAGRRPDLRHGPGPGGRDRQPCRAAEARRPLRSSMENADGGGRAGRGRGAARCGGGGVSPSFCS
jgi:subfamily B ATP-binding cassette protein MsbA